MRKFVVPALAAICLSGASAAQAEIETVSVEVAHADLDLATDAGMITLETRIDAAIKQVCAKPDARNLKAMQAWESCKTDAKADAYEQLENATQLASL